MVNEVILVGNVGKNVESRTVNGVTVANFTLATSEGYKDKSGQWQSTTEWHNIVCWRGLADYAVNRIEKGRLIYVHGKIKSRSWEDNNGVKHYATDIVADTIKPLGNNADKVKSAPVETDYSAATVDDLPF